MISRNKKWCFISDVSPSLSKKKKKKNRSMKRRFTREPSTLTQTFYTALSKFNPLVPKLQPKNYLLSNNLKEFRFSELKAATKNFSPSSKIGEGGYGCVYTGIIKNPRGSTKRLKVAVKQLRRRGLELRQKGLQGLKVWTTEVNVLAMADHPNIVKLVGYCAQDDEREDDEREIQRLLVYEYMPNRSVEDHLSTTSEAPLSWTMRLKVAQHAARALAFLHEDLQMIFRDFKSSSILLDDQWNAKLSDIGLARILPERLTHDVTTAVVEATGYMSPEQYKTGNHTYKSDIWSYGVFLYELITGRLPWDTTRPENEQKLLEWVKPYVYVDSERFKLIIDPRLKNNYSLESAWKLSVIANKCLAINPNFRPKMSEVLEMVNQIIAGVPSQEPPSDGLVSVAGTENMNNEGERGSTKIHHKESACFSLICCQGQP